MNTLAVHTNVNATQAMQPKQHAVIQPKLMVNAPGDRYEQEADAMADRVMRMQDAPVAGMIGKSVQRKCAACEAEKKKKTGRTIMRKTTGMNDTAVSFSSFSSGNFIQRKCSKCEQEEQKKKHGTVMRKAESGGGFEAPSSVSTYLMNPGSGSPLPQSTRSFMENAFDTDFSHVRIHTDSTAAAMNKEVNAKAFTYGSDIYFGGGGYDSKSTDGNRLLAHELTHTIQQNRMSKSNIVQCDAPDQATLNSLVINVEHSLPGNMYLELRNSISQAQWLKLDRAAQLRGLKQKQRLGQQIDTAEFRNLSRNYFPEIEVPLEVLLRPQVNRSIDFAPAFYNLLSTNPYDTIGQGLLTQSEIIRRWALYNSSLVESNVRVALLDPEGLFNDNVSLIFEIQGHNIPTEDGALYVALVDSLTSASGSLDAIVRDEILRDLSEIGETYHKINTINKLIEQGRSMENEGHSKFSAESVNDWITALQEMKIRVTDFSRYSHLLSELLQQSENNLNAYISNNALPFQQAHIEFLSQHMPQKSFGETQEERVDNCMKAMEDAEWYEVGFLGKHCSDMAQVYATSNIFTGGYVVESQQWHQAFRNGKISLDSFELGMEAAKGRAILTGSITAILTVATFGLAGPVLGPAAGVGSQVLFFGGSAAITTMSSMAAGSWATSQVHFNNDPYAQALWSQQGLRTPGQILEAGLKSFAIGGALTAAGPLLNWIGRRANAQTALALVNASTTGQRLTQIPGVGVRNISAGVVEVTIPGEVGTIRLSQTGFKVVMPAGRSQVVFEEIPWQGAPGIPTPVAEQASSRIPTLQGLQDLSLGITQGGTPVGVGITNQGWVVLAPRNVNRVMTGLWGEATQGPGSSIHSMLQGEGATGARSLSSNFLMPRSQNPLLSPGIQGHTIIDLQSGTPNFLYDITARTPGSRGIAVESGDWLLGFQGINPTNRSDLAMSRLLVQNAPLWPNTSIANTSLDELISNPQKGWIMGIDPNTRLFPQYGSVISRREPFFPAYGGGNRLIPTDQNDVLGLLSSQHPDLNNIADQIYWRRPFALQAADQTTQQQMGQQIGGMLREGGFVEFRLLRGGDRGTVNQIAREIPGAEIIEVNSGDIRRFLRDGSLPPDVRQAEILQGARSDLERQFTPIGGGDINSIVRIYKRQAVFDEIENSISSGAQYQVGPYQMDSRVRTTRSGNQLLSLDTIPLNASQQLAATRIHGQYMTGTQLSVWQGSTNQREIIDLAQINQLWSQGTTATRQQAQALAREVFDRHRGRYWTAVRANPSLRAQFESAGLQFTGGNNTAPFYSLPDGSVIRMTLEHNTRLSDNPTLSLSGNNLQFVLSDENSVKLEFIRRMDPFQ